MTNTTDGAFKLKIEVMESAINEKNEEIRKLNDSIERLDIMTNLLFDEIGEKDILVKMYKDIIKEKDQIFEVITANY